MWVGSMARRRRRSVITTTGTLTRTTGITPLARRAPVASEGLGPSLAPLCLLGLPLGRSSALWRATGLSYEEAVALHRALGHLVMALLSLHAVM